MLIIRFNEFFEYLVIPSQDTLILPLEIPERYKNRIFKKENEIIQVKSSSKEILHISRNDILKGNGVWIVADDCTQRGGIGDVEHSRQFFNIKIDDYAASKILLHSLKSNIYPISVYHGTESSSIKSILKTTINPSFGMLGTAVYVGTFWKAVRFACMSQDYKFREGSLLRILAFPKKIIDFPYVGWTCKCSKCKYDKFAKVADHEAVWKTMGNVAHVTVCEGVKNEEWALNCDFIITHYADVDSKSSPGLHHDPYFRKYKIL